MFQTQRDLGDVHVIMQAAYLDSWSEIIVATVSHDFMQHGFRRLSTCGFHCWVLAETVTLNHQ